VSFESVRINSLSIWLDGSEARAHQGAVGAAQDSLILSFRDGVKLGHACDGCIDPSDDAALYHAGEERRILRAPGEAGGDYLERLRRSWAIWYWGGTNAGLSQVFEPFYIDHDFVGAYTELVRLDPAQDAEMIALQKMHGRVNPLYWHAEHPPSCEWIQVLNNGEMGGYWDGNAEWFSRVFFLLTSIWTDPPIWTTDDAWGNGLWGDGGLWGTTMTELEAAYIRNMVRRMKSPGSYPTLAAIQLEGDMWGSPGDWGDGGLWDSVEGVAYLTIGHVWGEEAWLQPGTVDLWGSDGIWEAFEGDPPQR